MSNSQKSSSRKASPLRVVAAGAVAVALLGSSFNAARGGSNGGYEDDDSGISGAAVAGIVVGGGAAAYLIAGAIAKEKDKEEGTTTSRATSKKIESVRVSPKHVRLDRGGLMDFQVQVRYSGEETWQNVTGSSDASLKVVDSSGRIVAVDGAKNVFTAPVDAKGGPATVKVVGSYDGVQATSTVAVQ